MAEWLCEKCGYPYRWHKDEQKGICGYCKAIIHQQKYNDYLHYLCNKVIDKLMGL